MENEQNDGSNILPILADIASGKQYALPIAYEKYSPVQEKFSKEHNLDIARSEKGVVIARKGSVKELVSPERRTLMYSEYLYSDKVETQKAAAQMFEDMEEKSIAVACLELLEYRDQNPGEFSRFNGGMGNSFKADIIVAFLDFFMSPREWPVE